VLIAVGGVLIAVAVVAGALLGWLAAGPIGLLRAADGGSPSTVPAARGSADPLPGWRDVRVTSPADAHVAVGPDSEHLLRHEADEFRSVARFRLTADGRYTVEVDGAAGTQVQVVPEVSDGTLAQLGVAVVGLILSLALLLLGLILLVVGLVRRSRRRSVPG
jgi:hypothetical protein